MGFLAWGNATQANLKKIIVLQKRAIRIIHKVPYNGHTEPLHKKSKILKLGDQYKFEATLFMHNYAMESFHYHLQICVPSTTKARQMSRPDNQISYVYQDAIQASLVNFLNIIK